MNHPLVPAQATARRPLRRASQLLPLEQRFMFDGALADAVHAAQTHDTAPLPLPQAVTLRAADPAKDGGKKEVVLVDTSLADYKTLEAGLRDGVGIVEFDGSKDGLAQIAAWAATQSGLDAIHILSHGDDGVLKLGTSSITTATLSSANVQAELAELGQALSADGDLLLYGCDIAAGDGATLLAGLAKATGADVAASTNLTGAARLGGDWTLESHTGTIEAPELALVDYDHVLVDIDITTGYVYGAQSFTKTVGAATLTFTIIPGTQDAPNAGFYSGYYPDIVWVLSNNATYASGLIITISAGYTFDLTSATGAVSGTVTYHPTGGSSSDTTHSGIVATDGGGAIIEDTYNLTTLNGMTQLLVSSVGTGGGTDGALFFSSFGIVAHAQAPTTTVLSAALGANQDTGSSTSDFITNHTGTSTISGTLSAALTSTQKVQVSYNGGNTWSNATTYSTGLSSWSTTTTLSGSNTFSVRVAETYDGGTTYIGSTAYSHAYAVDVSIPAAPTTPTLNAASDTGPSNSDKVTSDTTPTLSGTAESGSTVALYDGPTQLGTVVATGGGWSYTTGVLSDASHSFTATATDTAGNISAASASLAVTIETTVPTVSSVSVPAAGSYAASSTLSFTVHADENVYVNTTGGTPNVSITIGGNSRNATYQSGSGSGDLMFSYTVQAGETDTDGIAINSLNTNGATITDQAGNALMTTLASVGSTTNVLIDTTAPTVSSVSAPANGTYYTGNAMDFTVNFGEAVTVDTTGGTPRIAIVVGATTRYANYVSGSGTSALTFRYSVVNGDSDADGITVGALSPNGGSLKDAAGNNAVNTLNSVASTADVDVDGSNPSITGVSASTADGSYGAGQTVTITVDFSSAVNVDTTGGTPTLALDSGGSATYTGGSGSGTLTFSYTVGAGQNSADLDYSGTAALVLNGATIIDAGGGHQNAALTLATPGTAGSLGANKDIVIDTAAPTNAVAGAAFSADTGSSGSDFITKTAAQTISGTLASNLASGENVYVSLDNGGSWSLAAASAGANTWSLAGQTLTGSGTLKVRVTDDAGNNGTAYSHAYVLDNTAPTISFSGVTLSADTGISSTDLITTTSAQTISATLSGAPAGGDSVYGSLDNGATWTDITSKVSGTALTWTGVTLAASDTLQLRVTDAAGNNGAATSQAYVLDTTGPTTSVATVAFSADSGASSFDFITKTAAQTVSGTLSANLASGETVMVSLDNGASWTAATAAVGQNTWSLGGRTLTASNTLLVKVSDAAGNDGAVLSQAYVYDTAATVPTINTLTSPNTTPTLTGNATLAAGETMTVTVGGATYDVTPVAGAWSLDLATAVPNSGALALVLNNQYSVVATVTDLAGNISNDISNSELTVGSLIPPVVQPTTSVTGLTLSADSGVSSSDFITNVALQTVSGTLSASLQSGESVQVSADGGASWQTASASGTSWSLTGITLAGVSQLQVKVNNSAGDGPVLSQAYVLDTSAPTTGTTAAFSNDSGTSSTDFITNTAAQSISGTLSASLASGETVFVSLDNGVTWTAASATVGQSTWSLSERTLTASNTLKVKVSDAAGNDSTALSQAYVLDTTAPTITFSGLALSADTGSSSSDFITNTASQTIRATLSSAPSASETVYGSLDNGINWTNITNKLNGTALNWSGVALSGNNTLLLRVIDAAGNEGNARSQAYVLDTTAPLATPESPAVSGNVLSGSLSAPLATGESVVVSRDGGATWQPATASGRTWSSTGGADDKVLVMVRDAAGNDGNVLRVPATAPPVQSVPAVRFGLGLAQDLSSITDSSTQPNLIDTFSSVFVQFNSSRVTPTTFDTLSTSGNDSSSFGGTNPSSTFIDAGTQNNRFTVSVSTAAGDALVVNMPIADLKASPGKNFSMQISPEAFASRSDNASVDLSATAEDGRPLPSWLKFDPLTGLFEGTPPPGFEGTLSFKVTARDAKGNVAVQTFKIVISKDGGVTKSSAVDAEPTGRSGLNEQMRVARGAGAERLAVLSRSASAARAHA